jgi:hypothetical protein
MNALRRFYFSALMAALVTLPLAAAAQPGPMILHAPEASKLLPDSVYYAGKSANTQLRNSAGLKFADGHYVLFVLVDTAGYSSTIQEKYQGYLLTETVIELGDKTLSPGAYGFGFVGDRFIVTDIGTNEIVNARAFHDDQIQHPMPLQIVEGGTPGRYRLMMGRNFMILRRP